MHGVLKVKTTEEQEKARREKKEQQLKIFRSAATNIFESRQKEIYNVEILTQVSEILQKVPDWYTLWNYRREILIQLKNSDQDEFSNLLQRDLDLTKRCLMENPKSYATWHHRCWVMQTIPDANWKREIGLCDEALKMDERNFHCWDYRRFVIERAGISNEDELKFTDNKLAVNFSNFSSWHYRSTLFNNGIDHIIDSPSVLNGDLDLIHEAVYTDPNDQSPWFYYRWLIGRTSQKTYLREVYMGRILQRLVLVFAKPELKKSVTQLNISFVVQKNETVVLSLRQDNSSAPSGDSCFEWISAVEGDASAIWYLILDPEWLTPDCKIMLTIETDPSTHVEWKCVLAPDDNNSLVRVTLDPNRMFNMHNIVDKELLTKEVEIVRDLYEMEQNNKWVLLTLLSLLRITDPITTVPEMSNILTKLQQVDPLRCNYYKDLYSRYLTENAVIDLYQNSGRSLHLASVGLTRLYCLEWLPLITHLDLSGNHLKTLPDECAYLLCLNELNLNDNELQTVKALKDLPLLDHLFLRNNRITSFDCLESVFTCTKLKHLDISGNCVTKLADFTELVAAHPNSKAQSHSLCILYDKTL